MASQALAIAGQAPIQEHSPEFWEVVGKLMAGNWSGLSPEQKVSYARYVCESLHLNPATSPVRFIKTKQGEAFYLTKDATDQLRKMNGVSTEITGERQVGDAYVVTARATLPGGRVEESTGAVWIKGLSGDDYVNALMKAETKAKRRVTLSICGLGFLDESETETVRGRAMIPGSVEDAGDTPREVRAPGAPVATPARLAPLSAPRMRPSQAPNGAEEQRRKFAEAAQTRGLPIHEDMTSDDMAAIIDVALKAAGLGFRVPRTEEGAITARALHNALMALPPRAVDPETGEVIEGESREAGPDDGYADIAAATDQGTLLPRTEG